MKTVVEEQEDSQEVYILKMKLDKVLTLHKKYKGKSDNLELLVKRLRAGENC